MQLLEDVVELYQPEADARGITLALNAHRPLVATLDLDLMFQLLSNLLDNALKYVPEKGHVLLSAELRDGLLLEVLDDGPGIDGEHLERATEPFYRGNASARTAGEGLGLSMVAAIAQAHGAALSLSYATQEPRKGLRITLALPPLA
ncbi:sensor histidine kinase [Novosphingobium sp. 9]|uniref:sensor histidine kinase n=1 Tax=Novosphingobium sp. 9 TaxID=2025349 RepID=UPI0021B61C4F|nr:sensor histidine kinase [Novosphingobium sp. 9]